MRASPSSLPDVMVIEPEVHRDNRGLFFESYNERDWTTILGPNVRFVQDNHTESGRNVLRGLHFQIQHPQGKLVRVARGEVYDVAVDLRRSSAHFGHWTGSVLSERNRLAVWVPPGFAHGYLVLSEEATVLYKTTEFYAPSQERCLLWNDPAMDIAWPLSGAPILSDRDRRGLPLSRVETFR